MSANLNPEKALIFRITHRDNLTWMLDNGLHAVNGGKIDPNYRNIGNQDLIRRRFTRVVPIRPGGTLSNYVPFYFTPFSIMLFNIITGHNVRSVPKEEIAILVSSLHRIQELCIPFVFTNQHAYPVVADYFNDLNQLGEVPWALLQSRDFRHDPDDPGKKERYQAEALVWKHVPVDALLGICCYNETMKAAVQAGVDRRNLDIRVHARPGWYF